MHSLALTQSKAQTSTPKATERRRFSSLQTAGTAIGLIGGTLSALLGSLLIGISWLSGDAAIAHMLSKIGTDMLYLTIPFLILAAYCLDRLEKEKPQQWSKVERDEDDDNW